MADVGAIEEAGAAPETDNGPTVNYLCRKCRQFLFDSTVIVPHDKLAPHKRFAGKHRREKPTVIQCTSVFVEPLSWLQQEKTEMEEDIACPKCKTRIGSISWSGSQCSCGEWVTPAFQFTKSKIDEKPSVLTIKEVSM